MSDEAAQRIEAIGRDHGVPVINLTEPLRKLYQQWGRLPIIPHDGHYNGEANATMARQVVDRLLSHFGSTFPTSDWQTAPLNRSSVHDSLYDR